MRGRSGQWGGVVSVFNTRWRGMKLHLPRAPTQHLKHVVIHRIMLCCLLLFLAADKCWRVQEDIKKRKPLVQPCLLTTGPEPQAYWLMHQA